jgi:1-deoxy-D-xylulose-5-phosphate reductoisomerase
MVQFTDGSIKAQIGWPDMRLPIQYALSFPHRLAFSHAVRMDIKMFNSMQFFEPDMTLFPCLGIAYEVIKKGGNTPCALNAANETAVSAFLEDKIRFTAIPGLIERVVNKVPFVSNPDFLQLRETHEEALAMAQNLLKNN